MTYLALSPDQRYCAAVTINNEYILCNLLTSEFILRNFQLPSNNSQQTGGNTTKNTNKTNNTQATDPLLGASISNNYFGFWSMKLYQVFTNKGILVIVICFNVNFSKKNQARQSKTI